MPSTCVFSLNSPNGVYYSGQLISGSVKLTTTSEKEVRSVRIRFFGHAKVHWTESESYTNHEGKHRTRTVDYRGEEIYVDNSTHVHGGGILQAGTYDYEFNIALPLSCPTSCEGKYGKIRYELTLTLDRPFRFDNEFTQPITVIRTLDLNYNPAHRVPLQLEDEKSVGCWPCHNGDILFTLNIPQGGYAPGQTIRYSLHIQNQSMTDIKGYGVEFIQTMSFTSHSPHRKTRTKDSVFVSHDYDDECLRQMNRIFEGQVELPSMPPTTEGHCIVRVDYYLKLTMCIDGCHTNKTVSASIFVGTVPLMQVNPQVVPMLQVPQADNHYMPAAPTAPLLPPLPNHETDGKEAPPKYLDTPPPTFTEAVRSESPFVDPDATEHNNIIGFRPMYPTYPSAPEKQ